MYAVGGTRLAYFATGRWIAPPTGQLPRAARGELATELGRAGVRYLLWIPSGDSEEGRLAAASSAAVISGEPGLVWLRRVAGTDIYRVEAAGRGAAPGGSDGR